ncbi:MAG: glycogen synthase [Planctomycetes bacterium]|nr:glycogen synthase [Planctomycetota bacterium]
MKVLYIATECKPFSKVGGIGDVAGELPPALRDEGVEIEIATPWYGSMRVSDYAIDCHGKANEPVGIIPSALRGVPLLFVKNATYFEGRYSSPYITSYPIPFYDDARRFSFFSKACIHLIEERKPDIVHVNDWGLCYLFAFMKRQGLRQRRVLTVHNVGYQGVIWKPHIQETEMQAILDDPDLRPSFEDPRPAWNCANALRLGLELCDCANTVSPTYAKEMATPEDPDRYFEGGKGLHEIARRLRDRGRLVGILNGFEYPADPSDAFLEETLRAKAESKEEIGREFADPGACLFGFVGRAVEQKFKLLMEDLDGKPVLEHILEIPGVNVAILGTGLPEYEEFLRRFAERPNMSVTIAYDPVRAKMIHRGSDVFLMPSLYEPCGITQMESMALATPPLVRWTGGLADTVVPHTRPDGTGFGFDGADRRAVLRNLIGAVREASRIHATDGPRFRDIQRNAFWKRFLWKTSAKRYIEEVYNPIL